MSQITSLSSGGVVPPGTAVVTITGNTGGAVPPDGAGNINLVTQNTTVDVAGIPVSNLLTINFGISNLVLGDDLSFLTTGTGNVGIGLNVFNTLTSGTNNTALGELALTSITVGGGNTALGGGSMGNLTTGDNNVSLGNSTLFNCTSGDDNCALGINALENLTSGSFNISVGSGSGSAYNAAQSSNILIANTGDVADNNTIRIGTQGAGAGQQNRNFQAGIYNVTPAIASPKPVVIDSNGQLGTDSGAGILLTLTGNTGGAIAPVAGNINILNANTTVDIAGTAGTLTQDFGISNLILGSDASSITIATNNAGFGLNALNSLTSGLRNVAIGESALGSLTLGLSNVAVGYQAMQSAISTQTNVVVGRAALQNTTSNSNGNVVIGDSACAGWAIGNSNNVYIGNLVGKGTPSGSSSNNSESVVIGHQAGTSLLGNIGVTVIGGLALNSAVTLTGNFNTVIGYDTGANWRSTEANNIIIHSAGVLADQNTLRIGAATGSGDKQLAKAFICGIDGVNVGSVAKVVTMASDQLGTATITAGTGITVTPGANTITISAATTGLPWTVVTGASQALAVNNGYIANNAGTINFSLPASSVIGDTIRITGINNATGWQITQAAGQQIFFGTSSTTLGATGTITSSATRDSIEIVCVVANTTWNVLSSIGNPTIV